MKKRKMPVPRFKKPRKPRQLEFLEKTDSFYGGSLRTTRKSRQTRRPIAVRQSMHVVLRSSKAVKERSFQTRRNAGKIAEILKKHAAKNHVRIYSFANVGNHLHLHLQLSYRDGYVRFIRAVTAAIAMHVMNWNKWTREQTGRQSELDEEKSAQKIPKTSFWDFRPYTNVVTSWTGFLRLKDYVKINQFEAGGLPRDLATLIVKHVSPIGPAG